MCHEWWRAEASIKPNFNRSTVQINQSPKMQRTFFKKKQKHEELGVSRKPKEITQRGT